MTQIFRMIAPALALTIGTLGGGAVSAQSGGASAPALTIGQQTSLRCAAAFAVVASVQDQGGAKEFPPLDARGQEYFVRTMAQLMEQTGMSRAQLTDLLKVEVRKMEDPQLLMQIMPPCLQLLDSSGL